MCYWSLYSHCKRTGDILEGLQYYCLVKPYTWLLSGVVMICFRSYVVHVQISYRLWYQIVRVDGTRNKEL